MSAISPIEAASNLFTFISKTHDGLVRPRDGSGNRTSAFFALLRKTGMTVLVTDVAQMDSVPDALVPERRAVRFRAGDWPPWKQALLMAVQQAMICIGGVLTAPYLVAEMACAGAATTHLRVQLISSTFVVTGVSTLLQTVLGLRLAVLQGPSSGFLPPLFAFASLPDIQCNASHTDVVPEASYELRLRQIQGSLFCSALLLVIVGSTGLVGVVSRLIGPITIFPLLTLLCLGTVDVILKKMAAHWISLVQFVFLIGCVLFLAEVQVPIPYWSRGRLRWTKFNVFGQFPYMISISLAYLVATVLTVTNAEVPEGPARVDLPPAMTTLRQSPWFHIPYPGQFGWPSISVGLFLGMLTSCLASIVESVGAYGVLAKASDEQPPPASTLNRAILLEGVGSCLSGLLGVGVGVTTYSENVAVVCITGVASRYTMQMAGALLVLLGVFTKVGAVLATIPDPMVGGILAMSMCMIVGVAVSNLEAVDLSKSRNLSVIGTALMVGMAVPTYFEQNPLHTGSAHLDQMLNILLTIRMFCGGLVAFVLDNLVGGASRRERGFPEKMERRNGADEREGYAFPERVNRFLSEHPFLTKLPFLPSGKKRATP